MIYLELVGREQLLNRHTYLLCKTPAAYKTLAVMSNTKHREKGETEMGSVCNVTVSPASSFYKISRTQVYNKHHQHPVF